MKRAELRASFEAKGIFLGKWPVVPDEDHVLVVNNWGGGGDIITIDGDDRNIQAVDAVEQWATETYQSGEYSGGDFPNNESAFVIFHDGEVIETSLSTDWEPSFVATIKAA